MEYNFEEQLIKFESLVENEVIEEGFIRGVLNDFANIGRSFASIGDLVHLEYHKVYPKVHKVCEGFKQKVEYSDFQGIRRDPTILKWIATTETWRWYPYINDKYFNDAFKRGVKTGYDPTAKLADFSYGERYKAAEKLLMADDKKHFIKMIDLYDKRVKQISDYCIKHSENKGMRGFLRVGIYGLRDLTMTISSVIAYHS